MSISIPPETSIGSVHLTVRDLSAEAEFYERALGFRVGSRREGFATLGAGRDPLLVLRESPGAVRPHRATGLFHFAVLLPSRAWLARELARLIETDTPLGGASDHGVSEALYLSDPEGNGIEIYRDRPRAEWPRDGGGYRMPSLPLDGAGLLAEAPGAPRGADLPPETRIGHIHLHVRDIDEARRFYVDVLGFQETARLGSGALFVSAGGYHHHVGVNTWNGVGVPAPPPGSLGLRRYEIVLPDRAGMERVVSRLRAAGVSFERVDEGTETADRSGNGILLREAGSER